MPSRKIVLREERGNRLRLEKQESAQNPPIWGTISQGYMWVHTLFFQTAASTNAGSERPLFSNFTITRHTSPQLKGRPLTWRHLCSPSLFKDRERAPPKSLHGPESAVYSTQSSHCCIPTLLRRLTQSRQGTCAALSEKSQETSLEYLD